MKTKSLVCTALGMVLLVSGVASCKTDGQKEAKLQAEAKVSRTEDEKIAHAKAGGDFLFRLHQKGQLPGDVKSEHGRINCYLSPTDLKQMIYPLSQTYQVVKNGDSSTNNYAIIRLTKNSPWQLQRAWRTD